MGRPSSGTAKTLLETHRFFRRGDKSSGGWGLLTRDPRAWETLYRARWQHDKVVRSTHGVNCTGSCSWHVFVKDGIVAWETRMGRSRRRPQALPHVADPRPIRDRRPHGAVGDTLPRLHGGDVSGAPHVGDAGRLRHRDVLGRDPAGLLLVPAQPTGRTPRYLRRAGQSRARLLLVALARGGIHAQPAGGRTELGSSSLP